MNIRWLATFLFPACVGSLLLVSCGDNGNPASPGGGGSTVTLTAPSAGAEIAGSIEVTAKLDTSVVRGDNIKSSALAVDGTAAITDTLPFPAAWDGQLAFTLDTDLFAEGSHTIAVKVFDLAGNLYTSDERTIEIHNALVYSEDIRPVFTASCAMGSCHDGVTKESGLDLSDYDAMMAGSDHGSVVIPGGADFSQVIQRLALADTSEKRMPPMDSGIDRLDDAAVSRLRKWIDDGAKRDDGTGYFDNVEDRVFNTNQGTDVVTVLERETGLVMRVVPVGDMEEHLEVPHFLITEDTPDPQYFYVTLIRADKLLKYSLADYTFVASADVGTLPAHVILTHDGTTAFVSNWDTGGGTQTVQVVDTATMTVTKVLTVGKAPHGMRITHNEPYKLFIGNSVSDNITVVDVATQTVDTTFSLLKDSGETLTPLQIAIDRDDKYAFVACHDGGEVQVIDIDSLKVIKRIDVGSGEGDTPGCFQVEASPRGDYVVVANQLNNTVTVISQATHEVVKILTDEHFAQCHGVDISEDGNWAYVTNENTSQAVPPHHPTESDETHGFVAWIDLNSLSVEKVVEVMNDPTGVSISPGLGN